MKENIYCYESCQACEDTFLSIFYVFCYFEINQKVKQKRKDLEK